MIGKFRGDKQIYILRGEKDGCSRLPQKGIKVASPNA